MDTDEMFKNLAIGKFIKRKNAQIWIETFYALVKLETNKNYHN